VDGFRIPAFWVNNHHLDLHRQMPRFASARQADRFHAIRVDTSRNLRRMCRRALSVKPVVLFGAADSVAAWHRRPDTGSATVWWSSEVAPPTTLVTTAGFDC
jgi:hypothetical protein